MSPLIPNDRAGERYRRLTHRAIPIVGLALVSLVIGAIVGASAGSSTQRVGREYADAWQRGDVRAMRALFTPEAKQRYSAAEVRRSLALASDTATATGFAVGEPESERDGAALVPVRVSTRAFGTFRGEMAVPVTDDLVEWTPALTFPGLRGNEQLERRTRMPRRAAISRATARCWPAAPPVPGARPREPGAR